MNRKLRVAHLVSHPIQYYVPLYRELSKVSDIELTVYYYSTASLGAYMDGEFGQAIEWDVPLTGGYKYVIHPNESARKIVPGKFDWRPSWSILYSLWSEDYDIIWLNGYAYLNSWIATLIGRLRGIPVMLREEQTLLSPRSLLKRACKRLILPIIYTQVVGLYLGKNGLDFFKHYGTSTLYQVTYGVDNDRLASEYRRLAPGRDELRREFGIEDDCPVILFSGKLIDKKQPQLLLEAFTRLRAETRCHLLFVGEGSLKQALQTAVDLRQIPNVHFAGFLNQSQLPKAYCAADIFVLPSAYMETWGLVVNEAMNFSLPAIVSDRVGCAGDLVQPESNGLIFKSGDVESLQSALRRLVESVALRRNYGAKSLEIIRDYSIQVITQQLVRACRALAKGKASDTHPSLVKQ